MKLKILSLGAGVQSTVLALMVKRGELPPIHAAIFADPQEESGATYRHLDWLENECKGSFAIFRRTAGKLGDNLLNGKNSTGVRVAAIPAFQADVLGKLEGIGQRQCTKDYKTDVVHRCIRRDILGLQPRQRVPKSSEIEQWIGLSYDEPSRVIRVRETFANKVKWATPRFPLFEMQMDRRACIEWLKNYGVPHETPRSACVFCPYKQNSEWRRLKEEDPDGWARALEIDAGLRRPGAVVNRKMNRILYLHRSCVPLAEVDLRERDIRIGQTTMSFDTECLGMCGN
jgi:hypothetical protein